MDLIDVGKEMQEKMEWLEKAIAKNGVLDKAKDEKAQAIAEYDKEIAITELKLKAGVIKEFEGQPVPKNLAANLTKDIAKGICWQQRLAQEAAEGSYKNATIKVEAIEAILNGNQSIFRHLDKIPSNRGQ